MQSNSSPQGICDDVIFTGSQTISVLPFFFSLNLQNANKLHHQRFFFFLIYVWVPFLDSTSDKSEHLLPCFERDTACFEFKF